MPRTKPAEARELLLRAGVEEFRSNLQTRGADDLLAGLSLERIAARAGYRSVGMIYNLWRSETGSPRAAFYADLLERIAHSYTSVEVELQISPGDDLASTTRSAAMATVRYWSGEGSERHAAGRLLVSSLHIPPVREVMRSTAQETLEDATEVFESVLHMFGFRVREPLRPIDLTLALRALLLGYLDMAEIHSSVLPSFPDRTFEWRGTPDWNSYAVASLGIVMEMVEPVRSDRTGGA